MRTLLLVALLPMFASGQFRDPRWRTVGSGALSRIQGGGDLATCTANRDVYICNGTGCTAGANIHYCIDGTWTPQGSGTLTAADIPATPLSSGTSATLSAPRGYYVCTNTCTVTLPVPAAGYEFCIRNGNNVSTAITLAELGSSAMYENTAGTAYGTAGTGTLVSTAAAGNKVCLVGLDSTHYLVMSFVGAWTAN